MIWFQSGKDTFLSLVQYSTMVDSHIIKEKKGGKESNDRVGRFRSKCTNSLSTTLTSSVDSLGFLQDRYSTSPFFLLCTLLQSVFEVTESMT